jgi:hypothetical protein
MPLVIEDGTGVDGANSYITVDELRTYANDRGVSFPTALMPDTATIAVFTPFLIRAADYLETLRDKFRGCPVFAGQSLAWPRQDVWIEYTLQDKTVIPTRIKHAQAELALQQLSGIALQPSQAGQGIGAIPAGPNGPITSITGAFIVREKTDVLETEYSETLGTNYAPIMPAVMAFLNPYLFNGGSHFFTGVRI